MVASLSRLPQQQLSELISLSAQHRATQSYNFRVASSLTIMMYWFQPVAELHVVVLHAAENWRTYVFHSNY